MTSPDLDFLSPMFIVLNGAPAVGKTTQGQLLAGRFTQALRIDVDELRSLISGWEDDPLAAGTAARSLVLAMAETHVRHGRPVVVSQLYGMEFDLDDLATVAAKTSAKYREIILHLPWETAFEWFERRGGEQMDALGDPATTKANFRELFDRVMTGPARRETAALVAVAENDIELTLRRIVDSLDFQSS